MKKLWELLILLIVAAFAISFFLSTIVNYWPILAGIGGLGVLFVGIKTYLDRRRRW